MAISKPQTQKGEIKHTEMYYWIRKNHNDDQHELNLEKALSKLSRHSKLQKLLNVDSRYNMGDTYSD